jgi:hypothetical protein
MNYIASLVRIRQFIQKLITGVQRDRHSKNTDVMIKRACLSS